MHTYVPFKISGNGREDDEGGQGREDNNGERVKPQRHDIA